MFVLVGVLLIVSHEKTGGNDVDKIFVLVGVLVSHEKTGGNDVDEMFVLVGVLVMVCLISTWEQQGKWEQVVPTKLS